MKKIVLLFGALCILLNLSNAENKHKEKLPYANGQWVVVEKEEPEGEKPWEIGHGKKIKGNEFIETSLVVATDSVYYKNIVKRNGWFVGVGKQLTPKEIIHLNCYYKLTKKNVAGNWTYIEAFDGYGKPTANHSIGTYLVNQFDEEDKWVNKVWRDKLKLICKWEFIADALGREVIQERALDSEGNVVYIFNPIKIGDREYTGSFTDSWGMPIYMRSDSLGNDIGYANFVHITRDENGYEVLLKYFDRLGFPQKNKDGAYMTQKVYDKDGNQIKEASLNMVGDYMIDDFGNCGWENIYKDGLCDTTKYYNADWKPMLFPNARENGYRVYGFRYEYDEFGRDTAVIVINEDGKDCVDADFGFQRLVKDYNNRGQQILQEFYDESGNLVAGDRFGVAKIVVEFDSLGNQKFIEYRDSNGNRINGALDFCKYEFSDYVDGVNHKEISYMINDENELMKRFEYSKDSVGNVIRVWYIDNQKRIDSVDSIGRNILTAWYDLNGNPIDFEGMHKNIVEYDDDNDVVIETWMDKDENFVDEDRGYSMDIRIEDDENYILTNYQYCKNGFLRQAFQKQFSPGFESIISQWDITPYGEHARVGWWNNLHYKCNVDYTMYGDIRTMVGRNEFDEPSYLTFLGTSGEVYYFSDLNNGRRRYYDEYGKEILDSMMEDFKANLPKVYCVEVTDTAIAYPLGLRNGDIILSYGDWFTHQDLKTDVEYFYLETILKAKQTKNIILLRHYPETKSSEIVKCVLPVGRTSDLGFYPHKIYYTEKEKERLLKTCENFSISLSQYHMLKDSTILLAIPIKGSFEQTKLYHLPLYEVKDPGVVLYAKEKYNKGIDTWSMFNTIERWDRQNMFYIEGANLYITQDLSTVKHIDKQSKGYGGMRFVPVMVNAAIYDSLFQCYQSIEYAVINEKEYVLGGSLSVKEKQLLGKWQTFVTDNNIPVAIEFLKGGVLNLWTEYEIQNEIIQIRLSITSMGGAWSLQNDCIISNFGKAINDFNITEFNVLSNADEEKKVEMRDFVHKFLEEQKEVLFEECSLLKLFGSETFVVKQVTSKELVIKVGELEKIFMKTK